MTVTKDLSRQAIEISWDTELVQGETVNVKATKEDGSDPSTRDNIPNDGHCTYTFPADYHGTALFTVTGDNGGEDTGTISV